MKIYHTCSNTQDIYLIRYAVGSVSWFCAVLALVVQSIHRGHVIPFIPELLAREHNEVHQTHLCIKTATS